MRGGSDELQCRRALHNFDSGPAPAVFHIQFEFAWESPKLCVCATPHQRRLFGAFIRAPAGNGVAPGHLCGRLSGLPRGRNSAADSASESELPPQGRTEPRARGVLPFVINTQILIRPSGGNQTLGERERRRGGGSPDSRVLFSLFCTCIFSSALCGN